MTDDLAGDVDNEQPGERTPGWSGRSGNLAATRRPRAGRIRSCSLPPRVKPGRRWPPERGHGAGSRQAGGLADGSASLSAEILMPLHIFLRLLCGLALRLRRLAHARIHHLRRNSSGLSPGRLGREAAIRFVLRRLGRSFGVE
jgi:hypothetical protein